MLLHNLRAAHIAVALVFGIGFAVSRSFGTTTFDLFFYSDNPAARANVLKFDISKERSYGYQLIVGSAWGSLLS